jgi:RNA polymerase sigma-70 factor (ECF subfamily)
LFGFGSITTSLRQSREWLRGLRAGGPNGDEAVARLHDALVRAAAFEATRRRAASTRVSSDRNDVAVEAADDALIDVCARLEDFRGDSRFRPRPASSPSGRQR